MKLFGLSIKIGIVLSFLCAFAISIGVGQENSESCDVSVSTSESLQGAIDSASEDAVVCLHQGTWRENLSIQKNIELRAVESGQSILTNNATGLPIVHVTSLEEAPQTVSVKISGVVISGADGQCEEPNAEICPGGVLLDSLADVAIENSSVSLNLQRSTGIWMRDRAKLSLVNSTVSGNGSHGVRADDQSQLEITNSTVSQNGEFARDLGTLFHGIQLSQDTSGRIVNSVIADNFDVGVFVIQNAAVDILNSTISGNFQGVEQGTLGRVLIENSTIAGSRSNGILIGFFGPVILNNNTIRGSENFGITLFLERCGFNGGPEDFNGEISGSNNTIPGPNANEDDANARGAFCPSELDFLLTPEGGSFP